MLSREYFYSFFSPSAAGGFIPKHCTNKQNSRHAVWYVHFMLRAWSTKHVPVGIVVPLHMSIPARTVGMHIMCPSLLIYIVIKPISASARVRLSTKPGQDMHIPQVSLYAVFCTCTPMHTRTSIHVHTQELHTL